MMNCIIKCPECRKSIYFTKDGILRSSEHENSIPDKIKENNRNILKLITIDDKLLMEAKSTHKILQLFETKIKIMEPKIIGNYNCEEIPLRRIKSIQFNESTLLYIGSIKFTIEGEENEMIPRIRINTISWPTKTFNNQFKLIKEAILQQKTLIKD
jgi:hypothetical protein